MRLNHDEITRILDHPQTWDSLFEHARTVRNANFGKEVFAYGFDYFSTYCKNSCSFCLYRCGNDKAPRYRHGLGEIVHTTGLLARSGVHLIDLTMGEDPYYHRQPDQLAEIVHAVHECTYLPVMISPGVVGPDTLFKLAKAGATWLALYQESFCRQKYAKLRLWQDFDERLAVKETAINMGMLVEEGILTGWGDTNSDIAHSLIEMQKTRPSQVRVMSFVPQPGTPLAYLSPQPHDRELAIIALLRIMYPDLLIPASLDVDGIGGLQARLNAGANVVTSIIPPKSGLEGVARNSDIEQGGRTLSQALPIIHSCGLELASQRHYEDYIATAQMERTRSRIGSFA